MATPDKAQQTPLETLTAMNEQVGRTRKRPARPVDTQKRVERFYRKQLLQIVREIAKEVKADILPILREEKADYTGDSYTIDAWADRIIQALTALAEKYTASSFLSQYRRMAQRTVSMAEAETTQAFVDSVNKAVGVDLRPMLSSENMSGYLEVATQANVELIKSVPMEYFDRIQNAVFGGVRNGDAPTTIARNIQKATGITDRRARLIARDQSAKLTGEISERRQKQSGIKYFKWITSKDERVGTDHARAAARDVGYGPGVYRWDNPPKEGIPGSATRPNCRCTATPIFEWQLPKDKRK